MQSLLLASGFALSFTAMILARRALKLSSNATHVLKRVCTSSISSSSLFLCPLPSSTRVPKCNFIPYSHGGYMGAACEMLRNDTCVHLLRTLTPMSWKRLRMLDIYGSKLFNPPRPLSSTSIMSLLENNPVLAAFGMMHAIKNQQSQPNSISSIQTKLSPVVVELDVHLHDRSHSHSEGVPPSSSPSSPLPHTSAMDIEIVQDTVVSHGSIIDLIIGRMGIFSMHTRMLHSSGGMTIPTWLSIYQESLETLLRAGEESPLTSPSPSTNTTTTLLSVFLDVKTSKASPSSLRALVRGLNHLGVHVYGVGSFMHSQITYHHLPSSLLQVEEEKDVQVLEERRNGKLVHPAPPLPQPSSSPLSSFQSREEKEIIVSHLPGMEVERITRRNHENNTSFPSQEDTVLLYPAPIWFKIFTFASAVIQAATTGRLPPNSDVLFNAGSLLIPVISGSSSFSSSSSSTTWMIDEEVTSALLQCVRRYNLRIGLYIQESHLDADAATVLINHVNASSPASSQEQQKQQQQQKEPKLYFYGLSYSNLPGYCAADIGDKTSGRSPSNGILIPNFLKPFVKSRR